MLCYQQGRWELRNTFSEGAQSEHIKHLWAWPLETSFWWCRGFVLNILQTPGHLFPAIRLIVMGLGAQSEDAYQFQQVGWLKSIVLEKRTQEPKNDPSLWLCGSEFTMSQGSSMLVFRTYTTRVYTTRSRVLPWRRWICALLDQSLVQCFSWWRNLWVLWEEESQHCQYRHSPEKYN